MRFLKNSYPLILLFFLNVILKSLCLRAEPVSHDEPFTIYHAQFAVGDLIMYLKQYNNPPLFEIILHFWIKVFGISEAAVRCLPMLFSALSVIPVYLVGRDFFNTRVAIVSSLLFTFSTMQIWYAHDCRVYSLFLLLTALSVYLFFILLRAGKPTRLLIASLILTNTLIVYAHYFGFFVWLIEGLILVFYYRANRKLWFSFSAVMFFSILLYVPHIITLYERFFDSATHGTWLKAPAGIESLYNMIWSFSNAPLIAVLCLTLFAMSLIKFFAFTNRKISNPFVTYLIIWFTVPFFAMFFLSYRIPMFLDRYLIFITPAFYLLLAIGLCFLFPGRKVYLTGAIILVGAFMFSVSLNPSKKRAVRDVVDLIKQRQDSETLVLICAPEFMTTFAYYYNNSYFKQVDRHSEYSRLTELLNKDHIYFINRIDPMISENIGHYKKLIYLDAGADFSIPGNHIKEDLLKTYPLQEETFHPELFHTYFFSTKTP